MTASGPYWSGNIGSGNGLVLLGSKPLPEPIWTQFYVAIDHDEFREFEILWSESTSSSVYGSDPAMKTTKCSNYWNLISYSVSARL